MRVLSASFMCALLGSGVVRGACLAFFRNCFVLVLVGVYLCVTLFRVCKYMYLYRYLFLRPFFLEEIFFAF